MGFIKGLGFQSIILKCDTKSLEDAVIPACAGVEVFPQKPLEGDHMASGRVDTASRDVKRQCRTLWISAEHNTSADDCPLLSWLPCFADQIINK